MKNVKAFTLVELIVVIIILAILGTIAFISLQGYSQNARDSSRISDINQIKTALEIQSLASGKYPMPDNYFDVIWSGTVIARHQGKVGDNVTKILSTILNEKPTDPLYNTEYIYSVTPTQFEFEVMSVYESDIVYSTQYKTQILQQTNANSNTVRIDGTYNGIYVKTKNHLIPTPSIINAQLNGANLELNNTTIKSQVINLGTNIPYFGTTKVAQSTGGLDFNTFEVYSGTLDSNSQPEDFLSAYNAIANTYSGSSLENNTEIQKLLSQTTNEQKIELTKSLVLDITTIISVNYSCNSNLPNCNSISCDLIYNPISENQTWEKDNSSCGYSCTGGYTGINCEIPPNPCLSCTTANEILTATSTYPGCNSADIIVCSGLETGYVISACNIGTNITGTSSSSNGLYFQWGNNHASTSGGATTSTRVNASNYGPGNYFSSDYFIMGGTYTDWSTVKNDNLWGYTDFTNGGNIDYRLLQGPCESGYHIPTITEWTGIVTAGGWGNNKGTQMQTALKLPYAGSRNPYTGVFSYGSSNYLGLYWSITPNSNNASYMHFYSTYISTLNTNLRASGFSIRCFKD